MEPSLTKIRLLSSLQFSSEVSRSSYKLGWKWISVELLEHQVHAIPRIRPFHLDVMILS